MSSDCCSMCSEIVCFRYVRPKDCNSGMLFDAIVLCHKNIKYLFTVLRYFSSTRVADSASTVVDKEMDDKDLSLYP